MLFVGASDEGQEGEWTWVDSGNPVAADTVTWGVGEPGGGVWEICGGIVNDMLLDYPCDIVLPGHVIYSVCAPRTL